MSTECCYAAFEPTPAKRTPLYPDEVCQSRLYDGEPCLMAAGANCDDDKMAAVAADETTRALDYIREMCLDRPCPGCKSEVIDSPQDDLRQCRACGHVWGFDDTQNLEDFVKEFGRMQPCVVCDNDSLDRFEVVENIGKQELICLNCHSVQGAERMVQDGNFHDWDFVTTDEEGCGDLEPDLPDPNPRHARELACPFCPQITYDFFEKEFDGGELVRVVCPGCSYVVFFKGQNNGVENGRRAPEDDPNYRGEHEDDGRAKENGIRDRLRKTLKKRVKELQRGEEAADKNQTRLFPPARKASKYLAVKPIELVRQTLQQCADSVIEADRLGPRLQDAVSTHGPVMGEQLGWTIGTAVGNIVFRNPAGASLSGTVGSIIGRGVCEMVAKAVQRRRV